ncbi:regulatory protein RecX [Deferribacter abyssi]|uniref:regulatory protein RecX n=1 Tax=Deferribacter abyssi TaxID=213806 RepID=UPI003C1E76C5
MKNNNPESYLVRLLVKRDYTSFEIRKKLQGRFQLEEEEIEKLLGKFKDFGYVDDDRYKYRFIMSKLLSREGPYCIIQKLKLKGISVDINEIYKVAEKNDINIAENAKFLAKKKLRQYLERSQQVEIKKLFEFLVRKGYDYLLVEKTVSEVLNESNFS